MSLSDVRALWLVPFDRTENVDLADMVDAMDSCESRLVRLWVDPFRGGSDGGAIPDSCEARGGSAGLCGNSGLAGASRSVNLVTGGGASSFPLIPEGWLPIVLCDAGALLCNGGLLVV